MFSFSCCGSRVVSWHKVTVDTERTSVRQLRSAFCSAQTYIKRNVKCFNKKKRYLLRNFSDIIKINLKLVPFWTTISAQRLVDAVSVTHQQKWTIPAWRLCCSVCLSICPSQKSFHCWSTTKRKKLLINTNPATDWWWEIHSIAPVGCHKRNKLFDYFVFVGENIFYLFCVFLIIKEIWMLIFQLTAQYFPLLIKDVFRSNFIVSFQYFTKFLIIQMLSELYFLKNYFLTLHQ